MPFDKFSLLKPCADAYEDGGHVGGACPTDCGCLCNNCMEICEKRKQARRGRNSRAKGKKAQNAVKDVLTQELGLSKDDLFGANGGRESDIRGSEAFQKAFGFRPEIKNEKNLRMAAYVEQADVDTHQLKSPFPWVVIFKIHGSKRFYATLKLTEFIKLVKKGQPQEIDYVIRK